jgi:hypothetical protein
MDKNHVYQVSVTTNEPEFGDQVHAFVFRDPVEAADDGHTFEVGHILALKQDGSNSVGAFSVPIAYRERTQGDDEDLGLTWQLAK